MGHGFSEEKFGGSLTLCVNNMLDVFETGGQQERRAAFSVIDGMIHMSDLAQVQELIRNLKADRRENNALYDLVISAYGGVLND